MTSPYGASRSHSLDTPHSVRLLWPSDQPDAENLYLTRHNTHKRQTSMPPTGFEPAKLASKRLQTRALDRVATGIGHTVRRILCYILRGKSYCSTVKMETTGSSWTCEVYLSTKIYGVTSHKPVTQSIQLGLFSSFKHQDSLLLANPIWYTLKKNLSPTGHCTGCTTRN